jgi:hypothetical protein
MRNPSHVAAQSPTALMLRGSVLLIKSDLKGPTDMHPTTHHAERSSAV